MKRMIEINPSEFSMASPQEREEASALIRLINEFEKTFLGIGGARVSIQDYLDTIGEKTKRFEELCFKEGVLKNIEISYSNSRIQTHVRPCKELPLLSSATISREIEYRRSDRINFYKKIETANLCSQSSVSVLEKCKDPDFVKKDIHRLKSRAERSIKEIEEKIKSSENEERELFELASEIGVLDLVNERLDGKPVKSRKSKP